MITRYITSITTAFSPFNKVSGKTVRSFLAMLPPNARSTMAIDVTMYPLTDANKPAKLLLKFKDGKELDFDLETMKINNINAEVDRHSRGLLRKEELSGDR